MKYFFANGNEIEEIETVRSREFIEKTRRLKVYESPEDIPLPAGYELDGKKIVPTADTIEAQEQAEKLAALEELDKQSIRVMRSVLSGTGTKEDEDEIKRIEKEVKDIRKYIVKEMKVEAKK